MTWDQEIDATGLKCPLPVLRLQRGLRDMAPGQIVRLLASDPMAAIDVPHFCTETGHVHLATDESGPVPAYLIRKGSG